MRKTYRGPLLWVAVGLGVIVTPAPDMGASQGQRKVIICHRGNTLEVAEPAVQAHLNHGDTLGACDVTPGQNR